MGRDPGNRSGVIPFLYIFSQDPSGLVSDTENILSILERLRDYPFRDIQSAKGVGNQATNVIEALLGWKDFDRKLWALLERCWEMTLRLLTRVTLSEKATCQEVMTFVLDKVIPSELTSDVYFLFWYEFGGARIIYTYDNYPKHFWHFWDRGVMNNTIQKRVVEETREIYGKDYTEHGVQKWLNYFWYLRSVFREIGYRPNVSGMLDLVDVTNDRMIRGLRITFRDKMSTWKQWVDCFVKFNEEKREIPESIGVYWPLSEGVSRSDNASSSRGGCTGGANLSDILRAPRSDNASGRGTKRSCVKMRGSVLCASRSNKACHGQAGVKHDDKMAGFVIAAPKANTSTAAGRAPSATKRSKSMHRRRPIQSMANETTTATAGRHPRKDHLTSRKTRIFSVPSSSDSSSDEAPPKRRHWSSPSLTGSLLRPDF